ncbi:MAG: N-6 DNA methylase [Bacteroidales bacterium]|nr:N-6 DNA methylase [Bacteroidales bacterium]MCF8458578.1 N-6 DNA methylase [Bacteroidales bacterium]
MIGDVQNIEKKRIIIQNRIDKSKSNKERNKLGQFATPNNLAIEILEQTKQYLSVEKSISFLDPAIGSGSFFSAFQQVFSDFEFNKLLGYEIDNQFAEVASSLWKNNGLEVINVDFTKINPSDITPVDLLVCNPPYVRHHHLTEEDKQRLVNYTKSKYGLSVSKLAGLYCHFLFKAHDFVVNNGVSVWLIPNEFLDVNYGRTIKEYLLQNVQLLRIHRFNPDNLKFSDALVSSVVVWFKKCSSSNDSEIAFTSGDNIKNPDKVNLIDKKLLDSRNKWSDIFKNGVSEKDTVTNNPHVKDLFLIKRGIASGNNSFFILSEQNVNTLDLPKAFFKPILPSPKYIDNIIIESDSDGQPDIPMKNYLLSCKKNMDEIKKESVSLYNYLKSGENEGVQNGYICKNRTPWYSQEKRESPLFICNYIGRENGTKAFRFLLNKSDAIVTNSFLGLYPKPLFFKLQKVNPDLSIDILKMLNSIPSQELAKKGRVYGGGMYKLEPKELENVEIKLPAYFNNYFKPTIQLTLFEPKENYAIQQ